MLNRIHDIDQLFGALKLFRHGVADQTCKGERECNTSAPKLLTNVYDNGDAFVMAIEVAGVAKDDLVIQLQGKHLFIKGELIKDELLDYTAHRQDIKTKSFSRVYSLPFDVAGDKITSSLANGILTLTLPKAEDAKSQKITIQ